VTGFITPLLTFAGYQAFKGFGRGCKPRPALASKRFGRGCKPRPALVGSRKSQITLENWRDGVYNPVTHVCRLSSIQTFQSGLQTSTGIVIEHPNVSVGVANPDRHWHLNVSVGAANPGRHKKSFAVVRSSLVHERKSLAQRTYSQSLARKSFAVVRITLVHARKSLAERIGLPSLARKSFAVIRITRVHTRISLAERIDLPSLARKSFALVSISLHSIRKS
jgi:hypothetical protein